MNRAWRILVGALFMLFLVMALMFMMSWFRFQTTLTGLIQNRLTVVGITLADSLEGAVDLGIGLGEVEIASALLQRARSDDPSIDGIEVFNTDGRVLFSTQTGRVSSIVLEDIFDAQRVAQERTWSLETETSFISGVDITNSFGQQIGGVVLSYSKKGFSGQVARFSASLTRNAAIVTLVFSVVVVVVITLGFRDLSRFMDAIRVEVRGRERNETEAMVGGTDAKASQVGAPLLGDLDARLAAIRGHQATVRRRMDELENAVHSLEATEEKER